LLTCCPTTINLPYPTPPGTTLASGIVKLQLDHDVNFVSSNITPDSINGHDIYWHYDSLFFFSSKKIYLNVQMPPFTSMGDTLTSILNVHSTDTNNIIIYTNTDTLAQTLVCAYDPNDKSVKPTGIGDEGYITVNQSLEYLIRFQNTGTDTAATVIIKDKLDDNLNWSSFQSISNSQVAQISVDQTGEVIFKFENIQLPDSGSDFLGSQGYVRFKIEMKPNLTRGIQIRNTGHIYFDLNPAVTTNTVLNTIYDCNLTPINISKTDLCINEQLVAYSSDGNINNYSWEIDNFYLSNDDSLTYVADTLGTFSITTTSTNALCTKDTTISITVNPLPSVSIQNFIPDTLCDNADPLTVPIGTPTGGNYSGTGVGNGNFDPSISGIGTYDIIYTYTDSNSCINSDTTVITVISCVGINKLTTDFGIIIYPNPSTGLFTIEKPSNLKKEVQVNLLDATSKLIFEKVIPTGKQKIEIDIRNYSKGIYYLQLIVNDEKFIKQILKN